MAMANSSITPPAPLGGVELAQCLARAEARCRVDFTDQKGRDPRSRAIHNTWTWKSPQRQQLLDSASSYHSTRCVTAIMTAKRMANDTLRPRTTMEHQPTPSRFRGDAGAEWRFVPSVLESALRSPGGCLVYAFGVQHRDSFTNFYATRGCEVFAFDPTVDYYSDRTHSSGVRSVAPHGNVTFYSWGLLSTESTYPHEEVLSLHGQYGKVTGELLTLPQIVTRLGHTGRTIAALKVDCEGCEFALFRDLWCAQTAPASPFTVPIASIVFEAHTQYSRGLPRLATSADVERIRYLGLYLQDNDYSSFQWKTHFGRPARDPFYRGGLRWIHPDLEAAELDPNTCCYLVGFVRGDALHLASVR